MATVPAIGFAESSKLKLGGAIRFDYGWRDYGSDKVSGLDLELLQLDISGNVGTVFYAAQYRWYHDAFDAPHHAYVGLRLDEDSDLRLGLQQVPFGLLPAASQSFWFGSGYYLGLEDDYDPGLVWRSGSDGHQWHAGFFHGDEYGSGRRYDRYSFDVASTRQHPFRERERLVARYEYSTGSDDVALSVGASMAYGRLQNQETRRRHDYWAAAVHAQWKKGPWLLQWQWIRYHYSVPGSRLALAAFEAPFEIAASADVPTINAMYTLPRRGWFDEISCYGNLSATLPKAGSGLSDSAQNVTGCRFNKGAMWVYADWIAGRNMWFIGGPGIGIEDVPGSRWHSRFNVNIGFYF